MAVYCIGDLHGRYDLFTQLLEKIEFDSINDVGTSTYSFNVPKNYFESGFYATQTVTVRENRGRYAGSVATWDIKYSFKPA